MYQIHFQYFMKLTILGCHSATPRANSRPTSQLLEWRGHLFLIDCGEGTQIAVRNSGAKFSRIKHIFISHLHGDHFFGLPGLISTFQLLGRETELHIYAPKGAKEAILLLLKLGGCGTTFPLIFHELESNESVLLFEDEKISVKTIPLKHRVYTNGFLFKEKNTQRRLNTEAIEKYNIETCYFQNIKNGKDIVLENGQVIPNEEISFPPLPEKSYAFCSDTSYLPEIVPIIQNVDVLYHESTFLENNADLAEKTQHSTALQAAKIAQMAQAKTLILGHYSARYSNTDVFQQEAKQIFENVQLSKDGKVFQF